MMSLASKMVSVLMPTTERQGCGTIACSSVGGMEAAASMPLIQLEVSVKATDILFRCALKVQSTGTSSSESGKEFSDIINNMFCSRYTIQFHKSSVQVIDINKLKHSNS